MNLSSPGLLMIYHFRQFIKNGLELIRINPVIFIAYCMRKASTPQLHTYLREITILWIIGDVTRDHLDRSKRIQASSSCLDAQPGVLMCWRRKLEWLQLSWI